MKVIPETCRAHSIWYLRFYLDIRINFEIPQMLIEPIVFLCDFSQNETKCDL